MKVYMHLREHIQSNKLKQKDIAVKVGINLKTLNSILHGKSPLRTDDLIRICNVGLGISAAYFLEKAEKEGIINE